MDFQSLLSQFLNGGGPTQVGTFRSLELFLPELILSGSIVFMLLARLTSFDKLVPTHWIALLGGMGAFINVLLQFYELRMDGSGAAELFTGLAIHDSFSVFIRGLLLFFLVFVIALTVLTGIPDDEDAPDFYALLSGAVVGMMLMSSANHQIGRASCRERV